MLVVAPLLHEGAARALVHRLKYEGVTAAARLLSTWMAPMTDGASALVPVPRVRWRRVQLGVDPALELARAVSALTGCPVVEAMSPAWFGRARAGVGRSSRAPVRLRLRHPVPARAMLVDDVVTTGTTLAFAAGVTGVHRAVTATTRQLNAQVSVLPGRSSLSN